GNPQCVALLLQQPGIDATLRNRDRAAPRDVARNDDVAALLVQFLADPAANAAAAPDDDDSD
ncbi:hypothetical protein HK405_002118, partial [Cladochytrium tenue]